MLHRPRPVQHAWAWTKGTSVESNKMVNVEGRLKYHNVGDRRWKTSTKITVRDRRPKMVLTRLNTNAVPMLFRCFHVTSHSED